MVRVFSRFVFLSVLLTGFAQSANADALANKLFGAKDFASAQSPSAYGFYTNGCLAGGEELPETGRYWQAMRLSRNRNWGHPEMVDYLKDLSRKVAEEVPGWNGLYIGDISQPRGGPMTSGHRSHQMGLDADIWTLPARKLNLSRRDRENLSSVSVRSKDKRNVSRSWTRSHMEVLRLAASDPRVNRVFITAPAKIWMCKNARGNKKWLAKVRPIVGHHYHFHVRLKCPKGSKGCKDQTPSAEKLSGRKNGCNEDLNWWVTDYLRPAKPVKPTKPAPRRRHPREYTMVDLPKQCGGVLRAR